MSRNPIIPSTPSAQTYAVDEDQGDVFTSEDPFGLFENWLALAKTTEPNDANAMALATTGADGMPDLRVVLLKDISKGGLTFFSSRLSAKGRELTENPKAAVNFHWKSIRRQVRFRGAVEEVSPEAADSYFATRARGARIGAWASSQSEVLKSPDALKASVSDYEKKFDGKDVARPDYWTGYRIIPIEIEFWVNRPFRLHDRLVFRRKDAAATWRTDWLNP